MSVNERTEIKSVHKIPFFLRGHVLTVKVVDSVDTTSHHPLLKGSRRPDNNGIQVRREVLIKQVVALATIQFESMEDHGTNAHVCN